LKLAHQAISPSRDSRIRQKPNRHRSEPQTPTARPPNARTLAKRRRPPAVLPSHRLTAWAPGGHRAPPVASRSATAHQPIVHVHVQSKASTAAHRHRSPLASAGQSATPAWSWWLASRHQRPAQQPAAGTACHSPVPGSRPSPVVPVVLTAVLFVFGFFG
jgi:hypothetical protein